MLQARALHVILSALLRWSWCKKPVVPLNLIKQLLPNPEITPFMLHRHAKINTARLQLSVANCSCIRYKKSSLKLCQIYLQQKN